MLIIGERINTSRKAVNEAVGNRDAQYIQADVTSQVDSEAYLVDVNAGSPAEIPRWMIYSGSLRATAVLLGQDPWCQPYTGAFREGRLET